MQLTELLSFFYETSKLQMVQFFFVFHWSPFWTDKNGPNHRIAPCVAAIAGSVKDWLLRGIREHEGRLKLSSVLHFIIAYFMVLIM